MALNLIMFPGEKIPLNVLSEILKGGQDKVCEAGAIIAGGHTIDDFPPKYGLAVVGLIHPDEIITNASVKPGDVLILTKKIGVGTIMTGNRVGLVEDRSYIETLENMKMLNKEAARLMNKYAVKAATDITGFGLLGHALKMANASSVCLEIDVNNVQFYPQAMELIEQGCIPGACFRNKNYSKKHHSNIFFSPDLSYSETMLLHDPQTSGGMLITVKEENAFDLLQELKSTYPDSTIIGKATEFKDFNLNFRK
jgi:selenide,water dikinase